MRGTRSPWRWAALGLAGALFLLLTLNQPFYAGSAWDGFRWRMEHGRLTLQRSEVVRSTGWWVDFNSEGLRWGASWRLRDWDDWTVTVPLWMPLAAAGACCVWTWGRRSSQSANSAASRSA